jgi:poly(3-hydroxybutyrate) depolymerase
MKLNLPLLSLIILLFLAPFQFSKGQKLKSGPQVLSFHSSADDTDQPYALYLPENFDENKKYPLVIMLHGAGSNHRLALRRVFGKSNLADENDVEASRYFPKWNDVEYIVAAPYARGTAGYQGIPEKDVYDVLEDVKNRFLIDPNRIYLTGLSMGGGGTLWIGLTRPDIWAAIAPVCPAPPMAVKDLLGNALNFPVHLFHGDADPVVPVQWSRDFFAGMKKSGVNAFLTEYPNVLHDSWVQAYENGKIFDWFNSFTRDPYPVKINFSTHSLKYNKAYWLEIHQINPSSVANIQAEWKNNNHLTVSTSGVLAFEIQPKNHPKYSSAGNIKIIIDQKEFSIPSGQHLKFTKTNEQWTILNTPFLASSKTNKLAGPIFDAFSDRHIYVYGTHDNPSLEVLEQRRQEALKAANWSQYRGEFLGRIQFFPRVVSDKEVRKSDLNEAHLILFGTKATNAIINQYANELPLHLSKDALDYGLLYVYPINGKYFVISSGLNWWANQQETGYPFVNLVHRQLPEFKDILLFKGSTQAKIEEAYFDHEWKLYEPTKTSLKKSQIVDIN